MAVVIAAAAAAVAASQNEMPNTEAAGNPHSVGLACGSK